MPQNIKTITGKNSVENRLSDSVGQTNRVHLHMTADYNPGTLEEGTTFPIETRHLSRTLGKPLSCLLLCYTKIKD